MSKLVARNQAEGEAAFEPRSRRPHTSPNAIEADTVELIVRLRKDLAEQGLDANRVRRAVNRAGSDGDSIP